jgi:hypothetical protein
MNYANDMGLDAMIYIPSVIKIGSGIRKKIGAIHRCKDRMEFAYAYFYFLKMRKAG